MGTNTKAALKVTFTLDEASIHRLQDAAARLSLPKSQIVREAILDFHDRIGQLSERERAGMLRAFDELVPRIPVRSVSKVDLEIAEVRSARRAGGRRKPSRGGE
jgi:hypothetical protein